MTTAKHPPLRLPMWKRVLNWLRDWEEALHYDPVIELDQRVRRIEAQLATQSRPKRDPEANE